ncbi:TetR/AcrR family transcriptional regulator [Natronosporangium hydrolyticum]|uniref:TetR/AcrR family transcriptional regulator n=1 Tax=Natronosporangium hydrolyticum TaxID=2811111 RepID=A0A895Y7Z7_9ACTN|nr:TetR/AcrR family transcriptional regulator [Natronosporangium hydrolyticum]QSB13837.1 TetR/AcrR family transcriptional regulator [Natronosporangium hydrolyticum]
MARGDSATGRRDGRSTDTAARVHQVALELFVSQGFAQTTMQQIADRLSLTKSALYYHHPTKADLVRSVVQPAVDEVDEFLAASVTAELRTREVLERFFDLNYRHRLVFLALLRDPSGLAEIEAADWVPRLAHGFQQLLAGPEPTDWQRICAVMAANGLSRAATLLTDVPLPRLRELSVQAALALLAQPEPTAPPA